MATVGTHKLRMILELRIDEPRADTGEDRSNERPYQHREAVRDELEDVFHYSERHKGALGIVCDWSTALSAATVGRRNTPTVEIVHFGSSSWFALSISVLGDYVLCEREGERAHEDY